MDNSLVLSYAGKKVVIVVENDQVKVETLEPASVIIIVDDTGIYVKARREEVKEK